MSTRKARLKKRAILDRRKSGGIYQVKCFSSVREPLQIVMVSDEDQAHCYRSRFLGISDWSGELHPSPTKLLPSFSLVRPLVWRRHPGDHDHDWVYRHYLCFLPPQSGDLGNKDGDRSQINPDNPERCLRPVQRSRWTSKRNRDEIGAPGDWSAMESPDFFAWGASGNDRDDCA
jgi:hypothetical protein